MGGWIRTEDQLPEKDKNYLVVIQYYTYKKNTRLKPYCRDIRVMKYDGDGFENTNGKDLTFLSSPIVISIVTHWMPLPDLPKEDAE